MDSSYLGSLNILQWNVNGLRLRVGDLSNFITNTSIKPHVICLQDTRLRGGKSFNLSGYNIERLDTQASAGGLAIAIKNELIYHTIDLNMDKQAMAINLKLGSTYHQIINVYLSPFMESTLNILSDKLNPSKSIIVGDFNSHSTLWGNPTTDHKGVQVERMLEKNNLVILNDGQGTFLCNSGNLTAIDLSIVSTDLALKSSSWVLPDTMGSDHFPLITQISQTNFNTPHKLQPKYNISKADWPLFTSKADEQSSLIELSDNKLSHIYENILHSLILAADTAIPKKNPGGTKPHKIVPYWTQECTDAVAQRKHSLKLANKSSNHTLLIKYRKDRAFAQRTIRLSQKNYWQEYCSTLTNSSTLRSVWRMARHMTGDAKASTIPTLKINNTIIDNDKAKAELFLNKFATISDGSGHSDHFKQLAATMQPLYSKPHLKSKNTNHQLDDPFELHELKAAISFSKQGSAPGPDKITYEFIKHLSNFSLKILLFYYNTLWAQGLLAPEWKLSTIIPVKKPGSDPKSPDSYRPIALTSVLCKLMERMITRLLTWYIDKNLKLNDIQAGFRQNRSTLDQTLRLHDSARKAINNNEYMVAVLLDFSKAFDLLWRDGLLYKLRNLGITGRTYAWISDFLTDRQIQIQVGSHLSNKATTLYGTPQGSVISPLLFLIMIHDFPTDNLVHTSLYADDSAVWKGGKNLELTLKSVQNHLNKIIKWCEAWGMNINPHKTNCIIFTNKHIPNNHTKLHIHKSPIQHQENAKFLGLIFDQRLNWNSHINYIIEKSKPKINLLRSIAGQSWGAGKMALLKIYKSLIKSRMEYGSELFYTASKTNLKKLESIQYQSLKVCASARHGTSLIALQNECGDPPIHLSHQRNLLRHSTRIKTNKHNPTNKCLVETWQKSKQTTKTKTINAIIAPLLPSIEKVYHHITPTIQPWLIKPINIDTGLSTLVSKTKHSIPIIKQIALEYIAKYQNSIHIFTDGSAHQGNIGSSVYTPLNPILNKLSSDHSVFDAELHAIDLALSWILTQGQSNSPYTIYSDSLSSLKAIEKINYFYYPGQHHALITYFNKINTLNLNITLVWIPAHSGLVGNENADALAKEAASLTTITPLPLSLKNVYSKINTHILQQWQTLYNDYNGAAHYKKIEPLTSYKIKYLNKDRNSEKIITRLRLGKCVTNAYLKEIKKHHSGDCDQCPGVTEDIEHIFRCPHNTLTSLIPTKDPILILKNYAYTNQLVANFKQFHRFI
jgi:ribonuclease HI